MSTSEAIIGGTGAENGTTTSDGTCLGSPTVPIDVDAPFATAGERGVLKTRCKEVHQNSMYGLLNVKKFINLLCS
ncbi:unnamed protein product [Urochloa humidicola]